MELNHDNSQIWLPEGLNQKLDAINLKTHQTGFKGKCETI